MRGMKNTRKPVTTPIPEELVREVTLLDLSLPDMRGTNHTLTDLKGKVVLLDFTVYQNQASSARNIALRELYNTYAQQGFEIYQVSFDTDEHFWKTSADNLPWICVRDTEGTSSITYRVTDLPTYFLIDRSNGLYKRSSDIKDIDQLKKEIEALLNK
jgi:glutathione peroxidase-family protein